MLLKKLVIAEDDDAVAHLVAASLGDAGFLCLRARDGEEALNLTRTELPDALVLDVMMPKLDGIEVCRRLKSDVLVSRVPILMLTSLAGVDDRVAGLEAGADDYLPKPFDLRELAARVKALIRQSRRERDRNPTTNLPGAEAIEERVADLLRRKAGFGLLYVDIENFRTYADVYGYRKADDVIAQTGALILQQSRVTEPPAFVGHVGGDDFLLICEAEAASSLADGIAAAFNATASGHYSEEDQQRGYITLSDPSGEVRRALFMSASIAEVIVGPGQYDSAEKLASEITRAKAMSRRRTGSGLFTLPRGDRS
ncbi:MAG: response regulator [Deltaproteobacteria bacterium]|nr:response regulator [Deltaproteobacteria bacterium]